MPERIGVDEPDLTAGSTDDEHIVAWIAHAFDGDIVGVERLPRWRPSWFVDVKRDSEVVGLYIRGERGPDFPSPFPLEHELAVHQLLADNGIAVPRAHGIVDGPIKALVLDRLAGQQGLAHAADDTTRRRLLLECVEEMVKLQQIGVEELRRYGMHVPQNPQDIYESRVFQSVEAAYLRQDAPRDPIIEFLRRWLRRHRPHDASRPAFVTWDSGQFLHHDGVLTGLIDFELAHVGHPYMDLAALRTRDSMEPFGDLAPAFGHYERLTGEPIDFDVVRYFEISQLTVTLMLQSPVLNNPDPESDYVTHLTWYVESARYAFDIMSELTGVDVEPLDTPTPTPTPHRAAHRHLVRSLRAGARSESASDLVRYGVDVASAKQSAAGTAEASSFAGWRARCAYRLARHLQRVDEIGAQLGAAGVAEICALTGSNVDSVIDADAALVDFIAIAPDEADEQLHRLLARRAQCQHMTLGPADSLIVRHPTLQLLRAES